jgi:Fe-S cluster assembly ATP-binding protein
MIDVQAVTLRVGGKKILREASLHVAEGEVVVLFGPNGCGKSSLLMAIMGGEQYRVQSGSILFRGRDVTELPIDVRARLGIGLAFQRPPAIRGVRLGDLFRICRSKRGEVTDAEMRGAAGRINLEDFLARDVNLGFSGGEIKRSELLQLIAQDPAFVMLDEPDSGVDLVNIHLVGRVINELLEREKPPDSRGKSALIVTHSGHILDYVQADRGYVLLDGTIFCSGEPRELLEDIRTRGYEGCVQCRRQN